MAVRLIGMLFGGKWFSLCNKCGERTDAMTEHILLYCPSANTFCVVEKVIFGLWCLNSLDNLYLCHHLIK